MATATKVNGSKALTDKLRELAFQPIEKGPEGQVITRFDKLAELIWKDALGWTEVVRDEEGNLHTVEHKPVSWAKQFLFERIEGKAPIAAPETPGGRRALDKVRDLAKERINSISTKTQTPPHYARKTTTDRVG